MGEIVATKEIEGVTLFVKVVDNAWWTDPYYCGYARFDEDPLVTGQDGIVTYIPVHEGVTSARVDDEGHAVYGFACDNFGNDANPQCLSKAWVLEEAERMALSIIALGTIEKQIVAAMEEIWGREASDG